MSRLKQLFARPLSPAPTLPVTRLSEQQAIAIAHKALDDDPFYTHFACTCETETGSDDVRWHCSTLTIGSGWIVMIDDASGEVSKIERWGIR